MRRMQGQNMLVNVSGPGFTGHAVPIDLNIEHLIEELKVCGIGSRCPKTDDSILPFLDRNPYRQRDRACPRAEHSQIPPVSITPRACPPRQSTNHSYIRSDQTGALMISPSCSLATLEAEKRSNRRTSSTRMRRMHIAGVFGSGIQRCTWLIEQQQPDGSLRRQRAHERPRHSAFARRLAHGRSGTHENAHDQLSAGTGPLCHPSVSPNIDHERAAQGRCQSHLGVVRSTQTHLPDVPPLRLRYRHVPGSPRAMFSLTCDRTSLAGSERARRYIDIQRGKVAIVLEQDRQCASNVRQAQCLDVVFINEDGSLCGSYA